MGIINREKGYNKSSKLIIQEPRNLEGSQSIPGDSHNNLCYSLSSFITPWQKFTNFVFKLSEESAFNFTENVEKSQIQHEKSCKVAVQVANTLSR